MPPFLLTEMLEINASLFSDACRQLQQFSSQSDADWLFIKLSSSEYREGNKLSRTAMMLGLVIANHHEF